MKRIKRYITIILSLVIVLTGIYLFENPTKEVQAETETEQNLDMLSLKFQRGQGDISNKIRVVASVDSPNYSAVGFAIAKGDAEEKIFTIDTKQYPLPQRIKSSVYDINGAERRMEYLFSPKVVDTSSEYFLTAKWDAVEDVKYTVRAWVKTFDGEMIYGQSRCITLEDLSTTGYLNTSFELKDGCTLSMAAEDTTKYADINVTYNETPTTAEVIDVKEHNNGKTVYVNVKNVNRTTLPSVTKFVFQDSENTVCGSTIFRNLYTSYSETTKGETTTNTADVSWYKVYLEENSKEDEFVIATSADLYGLANIVNGTANEVTIDTFANKKIYVVSDIEVNKGRATETAWMTTDADKNAIPNATAYVWNPIGYIEPFKGKFDGQGHTICGLNGVPTPVVDTTIDTFVGLFGYLQGGTIKDVKLENSYFKSVGDSLGSIAGRTYGGTIDTVYSDAFLNALDSINNNGLVYAGGIVGWMQGQESNTDNYSNCWYAGTMTVGNMYCGGILGISRTGNLTIDNCLFSGEIKINGGDYIGGLVGSVRRAGSQTKKANLTVQNCLNSGIISIAEGVDAQPHIARALGWRQDNTYVSFEAIDTYYTKEGDFSDKAWYYGDGKSGTHATNGTHQVNKEDITGKFAYFNTILDFESTGVWALVDSGTPILRRFADVVGELPVVPDNADITWYTGPNDYTICDEQDNAKNVAELYGFSYLVSEGMVFEGKTVSLGSDVTINTNDKSQWNTTTGESLIPWTPIGTITNEFAGTFDGKNHSISGVYVKTSEVGAGLFRGTAEGSVIKNLKLTNSHIESTSEEDYAIAGSIAGACGGDLINIYSNAKVIISSNKWGAGGLIGQVYGTGEMTISQCWFDGEVQGYHGVGGLAAYISNGTVQLDNCLNTGSVISTGSGRVGGLCGATHNLKKYNQLGTPSNLVIEMDDCLNIGTVTNSYEKRTGSVIGWIQHLTQKSTLNAYATIESHSKQVGVNDSTGYITPNCDTVAKATITLGDTVEVDGSPSITTEDSIKNTLSNLDFENIWSIDSEKGTPILKWTTLAAE